MEELKSWRTKTLVLGAILGAITGLSAAFVIVQQAEKNQQKIQVSPGDGVKLGMGIFTLLRLIADVANQH